MKKESVTPVFLTLFSFVLKSKKVIENSKKKCYNKIILRVEANSHLKIPT